MTKEKFVIALKTWRFWITFIAIVIGLGGAVLEWFTEIKVFYPFMIMITIISYLLTLFENLSQKKIVLMIFVGFILTASIYIISSGIHKDPARITDGLAFFTFCILLIFSSINAEPKVKTKTKRKLN